MEGQGPGTTPAPEPGQTPEPGPEVGQPSGAGQGEPGAGGDRPSEEELRARLEEQLRKIRVQDLLLETTVSVLNLAARRISKEDERDLDQARLGIEAVRALVGLLDPEPATQVKTALSEVQMLYARQAGETGGGEQGEEPAPGQKRPPEQTSQRQERRGSGLWTPPGTAG